MAGDVNDIQVPGVGPVGRLEEWKSYPGTWDSWVDIPGASVEELVCNGATRSWAVYRVVRIYQEWLMSGFEGAAYRTRTEAERDAFTKRVAQVLACSDWMRKMLELHYREVRREAARVQRELNG